MSRAVTLFIVLAVAACDSATSRPEALQRGTPCSQCRMTVLDPKLAAQLLAAREETRFFDDIGCLAAYLHAHPTAGGTAFVADHATGGWIEASRAIYGRDVTLSTPMNSHLFAHASEAARAGDGSVKSDRTLRYAEIFSQRESAEDIRGR